MENDLEKIQQRIHDLASRRAKVWYSRVGVERVLALTRELNGHAYQRDTLLQLEPFRFQHRDSLYAKKRRLLAATWKSDIPDHWPALSATGSPSASGWAPSDQLRFEHCPDCDIRGAIHADGHVVHDPVYDCRLSAGCDGCEGKGRNRSSYPPVDFYWTGKS